MLLQPSSSSARKKNQFTIVNNEHSLYSTEIYKSHHTTHSTLNTFNFQGQAVGGIVVALLNIVTIAVGSDSVHSASWSFLIGTLFTVSSLILYIISTRLPFYKVGAISSVKS